MKRFNLILIATAFAMTTACTEAEKLSPDYTNGNETLSLSARDAGTANTANIKATKLVIEQAQIKEEAALFFNKQENQYRSADEGGELYYGELMPLSFNDCGIFIQKMDGSFLEVQNTDIPAEILEPGGWVKFSYDADEELEGPCGLGIMAHLTYISFLEDDVRDEPNDETPITKER